MGSSAHWLLYRTVVLDPRAQESVDLELSKNTRFAELWRAVEWLLARTPEAGMPRLGTNPDKFLVCVISRDRVVEIQGLPELWILYSYTQDEVLIHAVSLGALGEE